MQDGRTLREHLEAVEKATGIIPKELKELPDLPEVFRFCWHDFLQLNSTRQSGMGMNPISYVEIKSYYDLIGIDPEPWYVSIIKHFDNLCLKNHIEIEKKNKPKTKNN